ncbi:MAG: phosphate transport system substrate-binding protein [Flavobacteriales bacterium]|jgi:phosphate transport system substrate-binding protein
MFATLKLKKMKNKVLASLAIGATALLVACGGSATKEAGSNKLSGSITIDGSSTVYPITEAVAEEFRVVEPGVRVTVGVSGTGGGFKKFSRGELDINDASRSIKDKEKVLCQENNISYVELSVAYDGLAVVSNPANDWLTNITVAELKIIWEPSAQGNIMKWNQIRPEWPNEEIHLFGPGVASGTYDYFTDAIVGKSGSSRGDFTASEDDNVLVQGIATDKYALGFFGLAYFQENAEKLQLIGVDNGTGAVKPTLETVKTGVYAPLSRPIFIYVNNLAAARPEVQTFVSFYMDQAGTLAKEVGYIPMTDAEYAAEIAEFKAFASIK